MTVGPDRCLYADQTDRIIKVTEARGGCAFAPPPGSAGGLLDWWKAESNGKDSVGQNDGTLHTISFSPGAIGRAFHFPGATSSFIDFGPHAGNFGRDDFTIQFWAKVNTRQVTGILGKRDSCSNATYWDIWGSAAGLHLEMDRNSTNHLVVSTHHTLSDGQFHLLTFVRRGMAVLAFADAHRDGMTRASGVTDADNNFSLISGRSGCLQRGGTRWLTGQLDEIKFYNRALSDAEIAKEYAAAHPAPTAVWISPARNNMTIHGDTLALAARAQSAHHGALIDHVNFTARWQGSRWRAVCTVHRHRQSTLYACKPSWNLSRAHVPNGRLTLSFDVYDVQGRGTSNPSGYRTVIVHRTPLKPPVAVTTGGPCAFLARVNPAKEKQVCPQPNTSSPIGHVLMTLPPSLEPPAEDLCGVWSNPNIPNTIAAAMKMLYGAPHDCLRVANDWVITTSGRNGQAGAIALDVCTSTACLNGQNSHPVAGWHIIQAPFSGGVTILHSFGVTLLIDNGGHQLSFDIETHHFVE